MHKISPESLEALIACVEQGSFSKAARKLNKSQATISILISNLEDDVNVILFNRESRVPTLTDSGKILYSYVRNIVLAQNEFLRVSGNLANIKESMITILLSDYVSNEQKDKLKSQFILNSDKIQVIFLSAERYEVEKMLINHSADIAIIPAIKSRMNYPIELNASRTWLSTKLNIYCSKKNPLMNIKNISEYDLKCHRRIKLINGTMQNNTPRDDIFVDSIYSAYRLCKLGLGWAELPEWLVSEQEINSNNDSIEKINISPTSIQELNFDILYRNGLNGNFSNWLINTMITYK